MFHSMKVQRTKMLATDPNLESNVMIFQGIEKMLFPILCMFHYPLGGPGHVAKVRKQVRATQGKTSAGFKTLEDRQEERICTRPPLAMHQSQQPVCRPTYPQATMNLLSVSVDLPILDISHSWNHTTRDLLCLASFI